MGTGTATLYSRNKTVKYEDLISNITFFYHSLKNPVRFDCLFVCFQFVLIGLVRIPSYSKLIQAHCACRIQAWDP